LIINSSLLYIFIPLGAISWTKVTKLKAKSHRFRINMIDIIDWSIRKIGLQLPTGILPYTIVVLFGLVLWCLTPLSTIFQLYRGGEVPGENHRPVARHWQTSSYNVVLSTPRLSGIQTHNVSDDRNWLQR
jgi:hypothetical protein